MAVATVRTTIDGKTYEVGDTLPDFGSIVPVGNDGNKRYYSGLSADMPAKLPKYDDLATDSLAKALDTLQLYFYHAPTKTWYEV